MAIVMTTAFGLPALLLLALLGMRRIGSLPFARTLAAARGSDIRGIALQTVIVMVVLLAIAGAVATVLLTRGGEAVSDLERQDIAREPADFTTATLCEAAGFNWNSSTSACGP